MKRLFGAAALLALVGSMALPSGAWAQVKSPVPTIPESQIEPRKLATPYEFLSAASSADEFEIKASTLALERSQSLEILALAKMLMTDHSEAIKAIMVAGKADDVDIAEPSPDGEQQALLGKLEALKGEGFDRTFIEAQIFAHQRAIAIFRGYSDGPSNLNRYAAETLPTLIKHYVAVVDLAAKFELTGSVQ